jgi:hypothetical protein
LGVGLVLAVADASVGSVTVTPPPGPWPVTVAWPAVTPSISESVIAEGPVIVVHVPVVASSAKATPEKQMAAKAATDAIASFCMIYSLMVTQNTPHECIEIVLF